MGISGPEKTLPQPNISICDEAWEYADVIEFFHNSISQHLANSGVSEKATTETAISVRAERIFNPKIEGWVLGNCSKGNINIFLPTILEEKLPHKKWRDENWGPTSSHWLDMTPSERVNFVLVHELEHRIDNYFHHIDFPSLWARESGEKKIAAAKALTVGLGGAALAGGSEIINSGQGPLAVGFLGLAAAGAAVYGGAFNERRMQRRMYTGLPCEVRANEAALANTIQFVNIIPKAS